MLLPKIKAVLFRGKSTKEGDHPIMIRITKDRKHTYKSIGFSVPENAWNDQTQRVYEQKPKLSKGQEGQLNSATLLLLKQKYSTAIILSNASHINTVLEDALESILKASQKLKVNDEVISIAKIKKHLKNELPSFTGDFISYGIRFQDRFLAAGSIGTYKRYKTMINSLKSFLERDQLSFSELTLDLLERYEIYLKNEGYKQNTIHTRLKSIRAILYDAMKHGEAETVNNPFFHFKLKVDKNIIKDRLSIEELRKIEQVHLDQDTMVWHAKNCFLFSFYCAGVRISDLVQLRWKNVTSDGRLVYTMFKTQMNKSILLLPKAKMVLELYKPECLNPSAFIFPLLNIQTEIQNPKVLYNQISSATARINKALKVLAEKAELEKKLSTHIARHSFSDIARKRNTSLYDISKLLGHSSIKITESYLSSLDLESQDKSLAQALDF